MTLAVTILSHGFAAEYEVGWVNGLAKNGVKVTLLNSDSTLFARLDPRVTCLNFRGSQDPHRNRFAKFLNILRYVISYLVFIRRNRGIPVHVIGLFSTRFSAVSLLEAWLTRTFAGHYVLTAHNFLPHDSHTRWNRIFWRLIYRSAKFLVTHSPKLARDLSEHFGIDDDRIVYVPHGVDRLVPRDVAAGLEMRRRFGIPTDARVILFFGAIAPYKGLDLLCQALARTSTTDRCCLLIAGRCKGAAFRDAVREMIEHHPAKDRIYWWDGFVPEAEVPALLNAADAVCLPYRRIDQSGVLFMALSNGLPVIATDVGIFRDVLDDDTGLIVPPDDPAALADALLSSTPTRHEPQEMASRLLWCETLQPMISVYRSCATFLRG